MLQENSKTATDFQNLTAKSAREIVDNFCIRQGKLPIIALDMEFFADDRKWGWQLLYFHQRNSRFNYQVTD